MKNHNQKVDHPFLAFRAFNFIFFQNFRGSYDVTSTSLQPVRGAESAP
jgi:hypothetical protein